MMVVWSEKYVDHDVVDHDVVDRDVVEHDDSNPITCEMGVEPARDRVEPGQVGDRLRSGDSRRHSTNQQSAIQ